MDKFMKEDEIKGFEKFVFCVILFCLGATLCIGG